MGGGVWLTTCMQRRRSPPSWLGSARSSSRTAPVCTDRAHRPPPPSSSPNCSGGCWSSTTKNREGAAHWMGPFGQPAVVLLGPCRTTSYPSRCCPSRPTSCTWRSSFAESQSPSWCSPPVSRLHFRVVSLLSFSLPSGWVSDHNGLRPPITTSHLDLMAIAGAGILPVSEVPTFEVLLVLLLRL